MENLTLLTGNATDLVDYTNQLLENPNFFGIFVWVSCTFYLVSAVIMFPIYLYVYRQNREKDKETAIYPIVDHFHWVARNVLLTIFTGILFLVAIISVSKIRPDSIEGAKGVTRIVLVIAIVLIFIILFLFAWLIAIGVIFLFIFHEIQFILHFLLALQRFLLYFYPDTEKYVNLTEKSMKRVIKLLYAIFLIITFKVVYSLFKAAFFDSIKFNDTLAKFRFTQVMCNLFWNVLLIISIILYLLIMNSVRKLTNLTSASQNKPQKYIFYQAILLLITRTPTWVCFVFCWTQCIDLEEIFQLVWSIILFIDITQTPFTIQVTYLFCNRRNVNAVLSTVNQFLCPRRQSTAQVNPVSGVYTTQVQTV